ncbi:MAG: WG repeat-containing protein, partial [Ferruginibacter sp.]
MKLFFSILFFFGMSLSFEGVFSQSTHSHSVSYTNNGQLLWDEVEPSVNGFSRVLEGNKFSFIDQSGRAIAEPVYDGARNFAHQRAAVSINEKWGFLNEQGKLVIGCFYDIAFDFYSDKTVIRKDNQWFVINIDGRILTKLTIDLCLEVTPGFLRYTRAGETGTMDFTGKVLSSKQEKTSSTVVSARSGTPVNHAAVICPPNLDFEQGNFTNWQCYTGSADTVGNVNVINVVPSNPVNNRHRIITRANPSAIDFFGLFPTNPPDGSNRCVRLGNTNIGAQAERIRYSIRVPQSDSNFTIKYDYAVVFQDPGHTEWSQPRFVTRIFDSAANTYVDCASFEYISTSSLPGFAQSTVDPSVIYKPWSTVFISLRAFAGRTM